MIGLPDPPTGSYIKNFHSATSHTPGPVHQRYTKAPSFLTLHLGIPTSALSPSTYCHHIILDDWSTMEDPRRTLFVSIPTLLDPSLAPDGKHIFHAFTPDWIDSWTSLSPAEYTAAKAAVADDILHRLS